MDNGESSYRRYLDGDEHAFDEIQRMYFDRLTFFADRYLHDVHAAEDVAIDTLLQLIIHKKRYNFKTSLKTYLYTIAHNMAVNVLKKRSRAMLVEVAEDLADRKELENELLDSERKRCLNAALQTLPEDIREAVYLVYFEDLSYEETAAVLGCGRKKVDNMLYRGKSLLRKALEKEGWEE